MAKLIVDSYSIVCQALYGKFYGKFRHKERTLHKVECPLPPTPASPPNTTHHPSTLANPPETA